MGQSVSTQPTAILFLWIWTDQLEWVQQAVNVKNIQPDHSQTYFDGIVLCDGGNPTDLGAEIAASAGKSPSYSILVVLTLDSIDFYASDSERLLWWEGQVVFWFQDCIIFYIPTLQIKFRSALRQK